MACERVERLERKKLHEEKQHLVMVIHSFPHWATSSLTSQTSLLGTRGPWRRIAHAEIPAHRFPP